MRHTQEELEKHGLRMSLEKSEVMWVGDQTKEWIIILEGKKIWQYSRFECVGGTVTKDGSLGAELRRIIQVGAWAWRKVE